MKDTPLLLDVPATPPPQVGAGCQKPFTGRYTAEVRLVTLREVAPPDFMCDTADRAHKYWMTHIATGPDYRPEQEQFVVLMLNTRRRVMCHRVATIGTVGSVDVSPTEVFRAAIVQSAPAILIMHNHPSGDPLPSPADITVSKQMERAGQLLKIDLVDHVIVGSKGEGRARPYTSLRELGYFTS